MAVCYSSNRRLIQCLMQIYLNIPGNKVTSSPNPTFEPQLLSFEFIFLLKYNCFTEFVVSLALGKQSPLCFLSIS